MVNVARARIPSEYTRSILVATRSGLIAVRPEGSQFAIEEFGGGAELGK